MNIHQHVGVVVRCKRMKQSSLHEHCLADELFVWRREDQLDLGDQQDRWKKHETSGHFKARLAGPNLSP